MKHAMYKVEFYLIPLNVDYTEECVEIMLDNAFGGIVRLKKVQTADIGEFEDDHELNKVAATIEQHEKYFKKEEVK